MKPLVFVLSAIIGTSCAATCYEQAAQEQGVPEYILKALSLVESDGCKNINHQRNKNDSLDYGCMGINSVNLSALSRFGLTDEVLVKDHCANVRAGAWIFAGMVEKFGMTWRAVGAYGAGTAKTQSAELARQQYADKVKRALKQMHAREQP